MAASGIITDVDQFTEPVRAPADGDPANGETFQDGLQDLANRTRNLKNRVDGHETRVGDLENALPTKVTAGSARYNIATTPSDGSGGTGPIALTEAFETGGYTLVSGNSVRVPAAGQYLISAHVRRQSDGQENPLLLSAAVGVASGGAASGGVHRWSATTSIEIIVAASAVVNVTDPATQLVQVFISGGGGINAGSYFTIARVS